MKRWITPFLFCFIFIFIHNLLMDPCISYAENQISNLAVADLRRETASLKPAEDGKTTASGTTEAKTCPHCALGSGMTLTPIRPPPQTAPYATLTEEDVEKIIQIINEKTPFGRIDVFNDNCRRNLRNWTPKIVGTINKIDQQFLADSENQQNPNSCFYNPKLFEGICSEIKMYPPDIENKAFLVYVIFSIFMKESSCNLKAASNNAPNDTAVGLLQLEASPNVRNRSGRDPILCETKGPRSENNKKDQNSASGGAGKVDKKNKVPLVYSIDFQLNCGLSIMRDISCTTKNYTRLRNPGSYWEELRSEKGEIVKLIQKFQGCKPPTQKRSRNKNEKMFANKDSPDVPRIQLKPDPKLMMTNDGEGKGKEGKGKKISVGRQKVMSIQENKEKKIPGNQTINGKQYDRPPKTVQKSRKPPSQ